MDAPDVVHRVVVPSTPAGAYRIDVTTEDDGTEIDTVVYARAVCDEATELACDEDGGLGTRSRFTFDAQAGDTFFVVVDGHATGAYHLVVTVRRRVEADDVCDDSTACPDPYRCIDTGPDFRCALTSEPYLYGLRATRNGNLDLIIEMDGSDAEADVLSGQLTAYDADGNVAKFPDRTLVQDQNFTFDPPGAMIFTVSATFTDWFDSLAPDTASVEVRLVDNAAQESNSLRVDVDPE